LLGVFVPGNLGVLHLNTRLRVVEAGEDLFGDLDLFTSGLVGRLPHLQLYW